MKVTFAGVRGSTPAPGPEFVRVGGHTSCLAITTIGSVRPTLVLDAGTGIRVVSELCAGEAFRGTVLLTHLHWDHTQGLPFFLAADRDDSEVRVLVPTPPTEDPLALLRRAMSPPHFPIGPEELRGRWSFEAIAPGEHRLESLEVHAEEVAHKGGTTLGFRLGDELGSMAYLPDHLAAAQHRRAAAVNLVRGVDVLLHDAQFLHHEAQRAHEYGHSTVDEAVELAVEAGVGELVLFHHSPARRDDEVHDALEHARALTRGEQLTVSLAVEGRELEPGARPSA
jgi:phosphoribosyl 1,2-cyclic phosphodiesterase